MKKDQKKHIEDSMMEAQAEFEKSLDAWANILLEFEVKIGDLNLTPRQHSDDAVMDATIIFKHVLFNVGYHKGLLDEHTVAELGNDLHTLVKKYVGVDTKTFYQSHE